jgi:hypothetical protein
MSEGDTFNGAVHKIIASYGGTPNKNPRECRSAAYCDIESMASLSEMSMECVYEEISRLMNDGVLMLTADRIEVEREEWVQRFEEACHDKGVPIEKVAEAAIKAIKRGQL